ncbi:Peptide chain release factor 2 [Spirochaeta thermophila DSM 6578]|uniref:Peptide chain release factor 2 n=1 Tax=Winmispira thermophila (strain ATCC 700085 / DSM 6578 / Z-1203) TaxID=869211 RepID=G0GFD6_WINT7|nr:Peptide chain release factor 2 [Spirochaeta thermophila DSM 6578]
MRRKSKKPGGIFENSSIKEQISRLEEETGRPDLWNDRKHAEEVLSRLRRLKVRYEGWASLVQEVEDIHTLYDLAAEENDPSQEEEEEELRQQLAEAERKFRELRLRELLNEEYDQKDAYLTIHAGAGGMEACDWASMLLRMYLRWLERKGFSTQIVDMVEDEGGIKSVTVEVKGDYAFGYLKGEAGVHRLVRISPFDASGRRHTSFASVYVSPIIEDDIEVDIRPEDLRIDTYRSQGAGGQHVNKTESAVRITHLPTGIVVQCQNERSQHKNREIAMRMLRSRLYEYYQQLREEEQEKKAIEKKDISWGNQIRSYVFQPYTMVKDLRTRVETGNIQAVMDGDLDMFIEAYLLQQWKERQEAVQT